MGAARDNRCCQASSRTHALKILPEVTAQFHQPVQSLSAAPDTSLEAQAFAHRNSNTVYLLHKQLGKYGSVAARPLGTSFKTAHWDHVLDGLVVFHEERAPEYLNR